MNAFGSLILRVSPSRIQSTPGTRSGTAVDAGQRPTTAATAAATLSPQLTPQAGNQRSASQTGGDSSEDLPVPAVPPRIQLSDLQNILSRLERTLDLCFSSQLFIVCQFNSDS